MSSGLDRGPDPVGGDRPLAPPAAADLFGSRLALAEAYADALASAGVVRGLLGPREVPRLWERHLLNCALLADELPLDATVVDVGSGAGLPGLVLAVRRPDLRVTLLEPMQRRVAFLHEVVTTLALDETVSVVRGRAEDAAVRRALGGSSWVVARAVAPLDRLAGWCLPLLTPGGRLLALKGARAEQEASSACGSLARSGGRLVAVRALTGVGGVEPTWVIEVERMDARRPSGREKRSR